MNGTLFIVATASALAMVAEPAPPQAAHTHGVRTSPPAAATPARTLTAPAERPMYRRFNANEPMLDWRAANDRVAQIGGWRAYAKEAAASAPKPVEVSPRPAAKPDGGRR